jgi:hypothetical protein
MGFKKYRGPYETVQDAISGHRTVIITCQACGHYRIMWAWRLLAANKRAVQHPLKKPVDGFFCKACRNSVQVVIVPDGPWDR